MPPVLKTFAAIVAMAAVAACAEGPTGGGQGAGQSGADDENAVRSVMSDLQAASREGDGDRICNQLFTSKLADSVTSASKRGSCAEEVKEKLFSPQVRFVVEDVTVADAANATATVKERNGASSKVFLVKQGGEWRVRSVQPA